MWYGVRLSWRMYGIPTIWEFSDEGIHTRNELVDSTIRWAALSRVEPMPTSAPLVRFLRDRGLLRAPDREILGP